ncbi:MerR family transcriptional regulator [Dactylosporangium salmoneum]|uniref:MerR family transcriptional regulator n=1 Tax=Dactylosporangium salmoneum TaxID=53361 RepID=A0ABN3G3N8_9ACTN
MLTIGEFATLTQLSVRTLRRYHEGGLLEPAVVDPGSGYRYYAPAQIPAAQVIHRLRELDVPLAEVRAILATDDPGERSGLVAGHLKRLEDELERSRHTVASVKRLLAPEATAVQLRSLPARTVAGVRAHVARDQVIPWYEAAMAELDAAFAPDEWTGPPGGQYANELFTEGAGDVLVFRPVREPRGKAVELPAADLAVAVHLGAHDDIDVTYGRLGAWVVEHALAVAGPIEEAYLPGGRTEIGWPVFRLTPG